MTVDLPGHQVPSTNGCKHRIQSQLTSSRQPSFRPPTFREGHCSAHYYLHTPDNLDGQAESRQLVDKNLRSLSSALPSCTLVAQRTLCRTFSIASVSCVLVAVMVLRRIDPVPVPRHQPRLASIIVTAIARHRRPAGFTERNPTRRSRQGVSHTTDSKSNTGPAPSEASYADSYRGEGSYHDEDPEVASNYRDLAQQDPPEYSAAPPAYDPSLNVSFLPSAMA